VQNIPKPFKNKFAFHLGGGVILSHPVQVCMNLQAQHGKLLLSLYYYCFCC